MNNRYLKYQIYFATNLILKSFNQNLKQKDYLLPEN